jgi:hypothetical protein
MRLRKRVCNCHFGFIGSFDFIVNLTNQRRLGTVAGSPSSMGKTGAGCSDVDGTASRVHIPPLSAGGGSIGGTTSGNIWMDIEVVFAGRRLKFGSIPSHVRRGESDVA